MDIIRNEKNCVKIKDPQTLDTKTLKTIMNNFIHCGYDFRNTDEVKRYISEDIFLQPDQSEVIDRLIDKLPFPQPDTNALCKENQLLEENFGITNHPEIAGYILTDGEMLPLSYDGLTRNIDHREINSVLDTDMANTECMIWFINNGAIRMTCAGFELASMPNLKQRKTIRRALPYFIKYQNGVRIDIANNRGNIVKTISFGRCVTSSDIMSAIADYFEALS